MATLTARSIPLCRRSSAKMTTAAATITSPVLCRTILVRPYSALQSGRAAVVELSACGIRRPLPMGLPARPPSSSTFRAQPSLVPRRKAGISPPHTVARTRRSSTNTAAPPKRSQSTLNPPLEMASAARGSASVGASWRTRLASFRDSLNASLLKPRTLPIPRWISPRLYTVTLSECFGHSSFILVAVSYWTDDFLMLRCIAVAGSTAMLFFTYFHPHGRVLWLPLKWNLLFIAINSYRIGLVLYEQSLAGLMPDEMRRIQEDHFYVVDPVDFSKLIRAGKEETYKSGDLIVQQDSMNRYIRLVIEGEVEVQRDGQVTYILEEGNFVSEAGLHAGIMLSGAVESCAGIVAGRSADGKPQKVRLLRWDRTELMDLLRREKGLRRSLKAALSWDIIRKLKAQRYMLTSGEVQNVELWTLKRNEQNDNRYAAILHNMLQHPDYLTHHKDELTKYRGIHHIDDEHHRLALEKCGWTPEEFQLGKHLRPVEEEEDLEEEEGGHYWRSKASNAMARILG